MTVLTLSNPSPGTLADANVIASNNNAILAVVNGNLDDSNIKAAAAIAASKLAGYPADATKFLRGDGAWQVPVVGMTVLADSLLGGAAASFDTNTILGGNIPTGYKHLKLVVNARGDVAALATNCTIKFNNDSTGANYGQSLLVTGTGAAASSSTSAGGTTGAFVGEVAAASATAGLAGNIIVEIPDYLGTTFFTDFTALGGSSTDALRAVIGSYNQTAAITRIAVLPGSGNFIAGSRFTLYGMP